MNELLNQICSRKCCVRNWICTHHVKCVLPLSSVSVEIANYWNQNQSTFFLLRRTKLSTQQKCLFDKQSIFDDKNYTQICHVVSSCRSYWHKPIPIHVSPGASTSQRKLSRGKSAYTTLRDANISPRESISINFNLKIDIVMLTADECRLRGCGWEFFMRFFFSSFLFFVGIRSKKRNHFAFLIISHSEGRRRGWKSKWFFRFSSFISIL